MEWPWDEDRDSDEEGDEVVGPQGESVAPMKIARDPGAPTPGELENHNATHCPYRSWCGTCVESRGKEDAHRPETGIDDGKPMVQFDYKSFGQSPTEDDKIFVIVMKDKITKMMHTHGVDHKGPDDGWIVRKIVDDIEALGHTDVILKSDGEPAIVKLMEEIKKLRKHKTILQYPPAYDPKLMAWPKRRSRI